MMGSVQEEVVFEIEKGYAAFWLAVASGHLLHEAASELWYEAYTVAWVTYQTPLDQVSWE